MDEKKENLKPCDRCGASEPIVAQICPGRWIVACGCCPCRSFGRNEKEARENWNTGVHG